MKFEARAVQLKNGCSAVLRNAQPGDAQELLQYLVDTAAETEFLLRTPEECTTTLEEEDRFIRRMNESPSDLLILCEVEGRLAGTCQLSCKTKVKNRHRGMVAIALRKQFWGLGIGTAMMTEIIAAARRKGLLQLELEVIEGNSRARALYEKLGFRLAAIHPNACRLSGGEFRHEYIMILTL